MTKQNKILIMGLNNCGKTSIILSLKKNTNLLTFLSLKPTVGLEIVNFKVNGQEFNVWDFGGQEKYRKEYLAKFEDYAQDMDKLIIVIDVQDIERYELALNYLKRIMGA